MEFSGYRHVTILFGRGGESTHADLEIFVIFLQERNVTRIVKANENHVATSGYVCPHHLVKVECRFVEFLPSSDFGFDRRHADALHAGALKRERVTSSLLVLHRAMQYYRFELGVWEIFVGKMLDHVDDKELSLVLIACAKQVGCLDDKVGLGSVHRLSLDQTWAL